MIFLAPWILALLALGGVIWLFHMRHRQSLEVSSLLIWQRISARQERKRNVSWWPRFNLLMALQLLILLCLVLALARPLWGENRTAGHWIYVLENAAAMQVGDAGETGFEAARTALGDRLERTDPAARSSLIVAGGTARALFADQAAGQRGLDHVSGALAPEHGNADWTGAARIVSALTRPDEVTRVVVLAATEPPSDIFPVATDRVGFAHSAPNAGLAARVDEPGEDGLLHGSGQVQFSGGLTETRLTIAHQATHDAIPRLLAETTIALSDPMQAVEPFEFSIPAPASGLLTLSLAEDAAAFDNRSAFPLLDTPAGFDVLYLGSTGTPLAQALRAVGGTQVTEASALPGDADGYDLVVVDGVTIEQVPHTNLLWIGTAHLASDVAPVLSEGEQQLRGWRRDHPLTADLAWQNVTVSALAQLSERPDAEILIGSPERPVLDLRAGFNGLDMRLAFDPSDSNWVDTPDIVVFAQALVSLIAPQTGSRIGPYCVVGQPCALALAWAGAEIETLDGQGSGQTVGEGFVPTQAGLFVLRKGEASLVLPVHAPALSRFAEDSGATQNLPARPLAFWPWLIGIATVLLAVEGILAHRRRGRSLNLAFAYGPRLVAIALAFFALIDLYLPWRVDQAVWRITAQASADATTQPSEAVYLAQGLADDDAAPRLMLPGRVADMAQVVAASGEPGRPMRLLLEATGLPRADMLALTADLPSIPFDHIASPTQDADVWIAGLDGPGVVYAGDAFSLSVFVGSDSAQAAELNVERDGEFFVSQTLDLNPGLNRIDLPMSDVPAGAAILVASVHAAQDREPGNNRFGRVLELRPAGRVAVLSGESQRGSGFASLLDAQGFSAQTIQPADAPDHADGWDDVDALVLMNQPASALNTDQQRAIETAVRENGMGLLIAGGPNSFGPGGYLETPLDLVSPISSKVPRDKPGVALVFVLDRSSSMGQMVGPLSRLDIAKQATLAAIRLLDEDSYVSVVTFDSAARLALPLTSVEQMGFIERSINQISLGGGTAMQRGLSTGYAQIRNADAAARHIIVMTDGLSQPSDYTVLMRSLNAADITLSTVAIGEEADRELVQWLAETGGGLFHATTDFEALPSILSQEAMRMSGEGFETLAAQPYWLDRTPEFLTGLPETFAPVEGYVLTTAKPEARMLAMLEDTTGQPVPLMAHWQYGMGQVLALTTDIAGAWSADWQAEDDYPVLYVQALQAFLRTAPVNATDIGMRRDGDRYRATLHTGPVAAIPDIVLNTVAGQPRAVVVTAGEPGQFSASFAPEATGPFELDLPDSALSLAAYANYPQHLNPSAYTDATGELVLRSGGMSVAQADLYSPPDRSVWLARSVWPFWLGAALALFFLDLFIRYSGLFSLRRRRVPDPTQETTA